MAEAQECLDLAERTGTVDQNSRFQAHGLLASAWARQGSLTRAMAEVAGATAAAEAGARLSYSSQAGFVGVAEALFAQWDRADRDQRGVETRLRRWLWLLRTTAFSRPILEPWDLFFRAAWNQRKNRRPLAVRQLNKAVRSADRMGLLHESAAARAEIQRLTA